MWGGRRWHSSLLSLDGGMLPLAGLSNVYRARLLSILSILLTIWLLVACSTLTNQAPGPTEPALPSRLLAPAAMDPCRLVLQDEAEAILGGALPSDPLRETYQPQAGEDGHVPSVSCTYLRASAEGMGVVAVFLITQPLSVEELWLLVRETPAGIEPEPVPAIGDAAFWESNPDVPEEGLLSFLEGDVALIVQLFVPTADNASLLAHAKQLALQALERVER
jgi:hypothetical protein